MYLSWAAYYEGRSDSAYFNVLIPRVLEDILRVEGVRPYVVGLSPAVEFGILRREVALAGSDICARKNEFHIVIVHADSGGRALAAGIAARREAIIERAVELCEFDSRLAVWLSPVRELEAWALADQEAVCEAYGIRSLPLGVDLGLPRAVERIEDPKTILTQLSNYAGRRQRDVSGILVRIAQEQRISVLRQVASFQEFERSLRQSLSHIGFIRF